MCLLDRRLREEDIDFVGEIRNDRQSRNLADSSFPIGFGYSICAIDDDLPDGICFFTSSGLAFS